MCISFAVMLPVGNPPNAIVFSYGHCQIKDMVSAGASSCRGWPAPQPPPEVCSLVAIVFGLSTLGLVWEKEWRWKRLWGGVCKHQERR